MPTARRPFEADLLVLPQPERGAEQDHVQPGDHRQLGGPADREVEEVAEDDLDQKGDEHDREQRRDDALGAAVHPACHPADE
jgi:hypothetical protein